MLTANTLTLANQHIAEIDAIERKTLALTPNQTIHDLHEKVFGEKLKLGCGTCIDEGFVRLLKAKRELQKLIKDGYLK
jgi:hypothetical protein